MSINWRIDKLIDTHPYNGTLLTLKLLIHMIIWTDCKSIMLREKSQIHDILEKIKPSVVQEKNWQQSHERSFGDEGYVLYLDCRGDFTVVYLCQDSTIHQTIHHKGWILLEVNQISIKLNFFKQKIAKTNRNCDFPGRSVVKNPPCNAGDLRLIPG